MKAVDVGTLPRNGCYRLYDLGCFAKHSFGELTLVDFLTRGQTLLPSAKTAFVMTDDGDWLEEQIRLLPHSNSSVAHWKIGRLAAQVEARNEYRTDKLAVNNTRYSVDFWTSISAARQCQAFVGHFGSALSYFVYAAMCFAHDGRLGHCPLEYDFNIQE